MNVTEQDKPIGLRGADILFDILKQCMEDAQTSEPGVSITKVEQTTISNEDGGENVITVTLSDGKKSSFTVRNGSAGIKGDPGINGVTPIIEAAAGENINVVGTPSVMASTNGNTTTFIFDKLKGEKGDPGKDGINATTTQIATPTASGLMDAAMVAKLNGIAEGANVVTHVSQLVNDSGYITAASIPTSLPANGGNADTVDGVHIEASDDAVAGLSWLAAFSDSYRISAVAPSRAYVGYAGNADTVDMYHASDFIGQGFSYRFAEEIYDINDLLTDAHVFLFNKVNTPTSYGFLDVKRFNGEQFAPSPSGVALQTWHDWSDPSFVCYRVYRQGVWSEWSFPKAENISGATKNSLNINNIPVVQVENEFATENDFETTSKEIPEEEVAQKHDTELAIEQLSQKNEAIMDAVVELTGIIAGDEVGEEE